jgi:Cd2+/Zn2+-exporting ATPase
LALLVVGCPCALVISTPVSVISAINSGARNGVLIKGGIHLEALAQVRTLALDKTGTLTRGQPAVVDVQPANEALSETDVLALAAALERRSEHPLARAIVAEARNRGVLEHLPAADDVVAQPGRGVTGVVGDQEVTISSHAACAEVPHSQALCELAAARAAAGLTPILVSREGESVGLIAVADTVRQSSRRTMAQLRDVGLEQLVMLTGDNAATAQAVSETVGVTDYRAELLPEEKVRAVQALRETYGPVAMVGDGINDAPALATADVGIAIGAAMGGSAQAMETADVALMGDDLSRLPFLFRLAQATTRTIKANVVTALAIKLAFLILVLAGRGTMWMAVLADMGVSLLVTLNGLRLIGFRPTGDSSTSE